MKKFYLLSLLIPFLFLNSTNVDAQLPLDTVQVGTGAVSNSQYSWPAPYGHYGWGNRHQMLILASELTGSGMVAGFITAMSFDVSAVDPGANTCLSNGRPNPAIRDFRIEMKNTSANNMLGGFDTTGLTTAWGPKDYWDTLGVNYHNFKAPIYWDGTSNLLVNTCYDDDCYSLNTRMKYTTTIHTSVAYKNLYSAGGCTDISFPTTVQNRPNMYFQFVPDTIPPITDFEADYPQTCTGLVNFTDKTFGKVTNWIWDFGDGDTSQSQHPTHQYSSYGLYTVKLVTTNSYGGDSLEIVSYINYDSLTAKAASCTPFTNAYCCGFGITRVVFNTLDSKTGNGSEGYTDNSCYGTTVMEGIEYPIEVYTSKTDPENVRIWADWDNNGAFDSSELVMSSNNGLYQHLDTFKIPNFVTLDSLLRMRVASDDILQNVPRDCGSVQFGQHEDYFLKVIYNPNPPVADFDVSENFICFGSVDFYNRSTNTGTNFLWDFGDGDTSHAENPTHTYLKTGTYDVTLTVTNNNGSSQKLKTGYITVSAGPAPAQCTPPTAQYCCDAGIIRVTLNQLDNPFPTNQNGSAGYENFSCSQGTNIVQGAKYSMEVETNMYVPENVRAWIDYNNDGAFDPVTELVFSSDSVIQYHVDTLLIPGNTILDSTLRMRIMSDFFGVQPVPGPCDTVQVGQHEDYAVTILANPQPPISDFSASTVLSCDGVVSFRDESQNVPATWFWDFGDGNVSTFQHPTHSYTYSDTFTVSLTVTNQAGSDDTTIVDYVIVEYGGAARKASCEPNTIAQNCIGYGIFNFKLNQINHNSACSNEGYKDFSCVARTELLEGKTYQFEMTTHASLKQDTRIWVDFDDNGIFHTSKELVYAGDGIKTNVIGNIRIPGKVTTLNQPIRLRIMSDNAGNGGFMIPCYPPEFGQVEDYTLIPVLNTNPPIAEFTSDAVYTCNYAIHFFDSSENVVDVYEWDFGDGTSSNLRNPLHYYLLPNQYTVSLAVENAYGQDDITKIFYVTVDTNCIFNMPFAGNKVSHDCTGQLFDDGGPFNNYTPLTSGVFIIEPYNADEVTATFSSFSLATDDWMYLWDGPAGGTLLIPPVNGTNSPGQITANSGMLSVELVANESVEGSGFAMTWTCAGPPFADFAFDPSRSDLCEGTYQFINLSKRAKDFEWLFQGVNVDTTDFPIYELADSLVDDSVFVVQLAATNALGNDTSYQFRIPIHKAFPAMNAISNFLTVNFVDSSFYDVKKWKWYFGDGDSSIIQNPLHNYPNGGTYDVTLEVTNEYCTNAKVFSVDVNGVGIEKLESEHFFKAYPNPAMSLLNIHFENPFIDKISMVNILGETIWSTRTLESRDLQIDLSNVEAGIYFIQVESPNNGTFAQRVIVTK